MHLGGRLGGVLALPPEALRGAPLRVVPRQRRRQRTIAVARGNGAQQVLISVAALIRCNRGRLGDTRNQTRPAGLRLSIHDEGSTVPRMRRRGREAVHAGQCRGVGRARRGLSYEVWGSAMHFRSGRRGDRDRSPQRTAARCTFWWSASASARDCSASKSFAIPARSVLTACSMVSVVTGA